MAPDERVFDHVMETLFFVSDPDLRRRLWKALCRDDRACTWRFALRQCWAYREDKGYVRQLVFKHLSSHKLVNWLERGVAKADLRREDVTQLQEEIFKLADATGAWR